MLRFKFFLDPGRVFSVFFCLCVEVMCNVTDFGMLVVVWCSDLLVPPNLRSLIIFYYAHCQSCQLVHRQSCESRWVLQVPSWTGNVDTMVIVVPISMCMGWCWLGGHFERTVCVTDSGRLFSSSRSMIQRFGPYCYFQADDLKEPRSLASNMRYKLWSSRQSIRITSLL